MTPNTPLSVRHGVLVDDSVQYTLVELSHACGTDAAHLVALVQEAVLDPQGDEPAQWRFAGTALRRARSAVRLERDLALSVAGTALVLDLLDEIERLRSRLVFLGGR